MEEILRVCNADLCHQGTEKLYRSALTISDMIQAYEELKSA